MAGILGHAPAALFPGWTPVHAPLAKSRIVDVAYGPERAGAEVPTGCMLGQGSLTWWAGWAPIET